MQNQISTQTGTLTAADGYTLFTRSWLPDQPARAAIVLVHGYADHSGRYNHVGGYFAKRGYAVYAFDYHGHGRSRGAKLGYFEDFHQLIDDLKLVIADVQTQPNVGTAIPLFVYGHSVGGLMALYYALSRPTLLRGIIVTGAALDLGMDTPLVFTRLVRLLSRVAPGLPVAGFDSTGVSRDPAQVKAYQTDPDVYHGKAPARVAVALADAATFVRTNLPRLQIPLLALQGSADRIIQPLATQLIADKAGSPDKTIKFYAGLYHEIHNEPEQADVLTEIEQWIAAHLP